MKGIPDKGMVDSDRSLAFSLMIAGTKCLQANNLEEFLVRHEKLRKMPLPQNGYRKGIEEIIDNPKLCYKVVILAKEAANVRWPSGKGPKYLRRKQQNVFKMIKQK